MTHRGGSSNFYLPWPQLCASPEVDNRVTGTARHSEHGAQWTESYFVLIELNAQWLRTEDQMAADNSRQKLGPVTCWTADRPRSISDNFLGKALLHFFDSFHLFPHYGPHTRRYEDHVFLHLLVHNYTSGKFFDAINCKSQPVASTTAWRPSSLRYSSTALMFLLLRLSNIPWYVRPQATTHMWLGTCWEHHAVRHFMSPDYQSMHAAESCQ